jgi:gliding motility-associated-like protein
MKRLLLFLLAISSWSAVFATHNRAGEITYRCPDPVNAPYTFEITVTTYTKASSQADRCDLTVFFGDGDSATFLRNNGPTDANQCALPAKMGQTIGFLNDTKYNTYVGFHTYPGPGSYWISMLDPNRNAGIENIPTSVNVPFYIQTLLVINPFMGVNNSPVLVNPPIDIACVGQCFVHNPGAVDADGDSIAYELVACLGDQGQPIPGFTTPPTNGGGSNTLDPYTGDYVWCSPGPGTQNTEWNIAILIKEYRKVGNQSFLIGSVLRDMQITVEQCNNLPPVITPINDTCVIAGTTVTFNVSATDPNPGHNITLTATGGPFLTTPQAVFTSTMANPATGQFTWTPDCSRIRVQPYQVTIKAEDSDNSTPLVDYETVQIRVVAPPPVNVTANPQGTSIVVDWDASQCTIGITGYLVYRRESCNPWIPDPCQTGVPSSSGYTLIGSTAYNVTIFNDNNNGQGLIHGVDYSYLIVAVYADGSQSIASAPICAQLVRDVPIITHVSVTTTSTTNGAILVKWVKPIVSPDDLDTIANPGPYRFELLRTTGFTGTVFTAVANFTSPYFASLNDTMYIDTLINTEDNPYTYKINFYYTDPGTGNEVLLGSTHTASSVYLSVAPSDNMLTLTWEEHVPWQNYKYYVYKETSPNVFTLLTTTTLNVYIDDSLVNGVTFCYRILAEGEYSDTNIVSPLFNWSEIKCEQPKDLTPPCAPNLSVAPDCNIGQNTLTWTNPNNSCADDVVQYNIYYTPVQGGAYQLLTTITDATDTNYVFVSPGSIAGCFKVTALDTFMNESPFSVEFCVDNCPIYELPNVFTPDGDNVNDLFIPFPYRFIESIDLKIYDRWGLLMFETTDPDIRWDGTNMATKQKCTAGVYYYTCTVNEIRVYGIRKHVLTGFVHLFPGNKSPK